MIERILAIVSLTAILLPCAASAQSESVHIESLIAETAAIGQRFEDGGLFWMDRDLLDYLNDILGKLATPEERLRHNLRVHILRSNVVNAFAAFDGAIYLTTGLLARLSNEAQIAAVLGHELGHIVMGHGARNVQMMKDQARAHALELLETPGGGRQLLYEAATGEMPRAMRAAAADYRYELEREADSVGLVRRVAAGYLNLDGTGDGEDELLERGILNIRLRSVILYDVVEQHAAGRHDRVEPQLDRLLAVDECDPAALLIRGDTERFMSPRSTAWVEWYEKALLCDPNDVAVLRAIGFAYHSIGNKEKAREYLTRYSELAANAPDIEMAREVLRRCE
jgi:predicted Zn-dependent protease